MAEWFDAKDKVPRNDVLVAVSGGDMESAGIEVSVGYYSPDYNCYCCVLEDDEFELCDIERWCELPEPP